MKKISILGGGNIGRALAEGLLYTGLYQPGDIYITRRNHELLADLEEKGINTGTLNKEAVSFSEVVVLAVQPGQAEELIEEISPETDPRKHLIISVVAALKIREIKRLIGKEVPVIRIMPNTAISIGESMTCIAADEEDTEAMDEVRALFDALGSTMVISESLMKAATIIGACGIAFFLRYIRAASQGGIQVGFHAAEAQFIAAQTARGAASILLRTGSHPEDELDKVTTPRGCTIAGLNEMEHNGFSSALIKGIVTSYGELDQLVEKG
jgi:pyrroline-5-carboxylate reductase